MPPPRHQSVTPTRWQTAVTVTLLLLWLVLMVFGGLTFMQPQWLQNLSIAGKRYSADTLRRIGDDFYRQGNYALAATQYLKALERQPGQFDARLNLALCSDKMGDIQGATSILRDMLRGQTSRNEQESIYHNLGVFSAKQGQTEQGIAYLEQSEGLVPDQRGLLLELASLYLGAERFEEARVALEKALASQLDVTLPYRSMLHRSIEVYKDDEEHSAAIERLLARDVGPDQLTRYDLRTIQGLQQSDAKLAEIHNRLSYACLRLGRIAEATEHMQKVLEIMPDNEEAKKNLAILQQAAATGQEGGSSRP